ncbi:MAG: AMP-binding protein [Clostridia bacterium]|nr:AMP-binding protein [Clostridia bacterium]
MANNRKFRNDLYPVRDITDIRDMLSSSARLYGDDPALLIKKNQGEKFTPVSYDQLKQDVDALGTALVSLGLKGCHIGLIGETRYQWILSDLAVVCGTGVLSPLDKDLPVEELNNMFNRAHMSAVIYSGKVEGRILEAIRREHQLKYIISMDSAEHVGKRLSLSKLLEEGREMLRNGNRDFVDAEIDPEAMAYLLFTSGTTGFAKGVMLSHKNIATNTVKMARYFHINRREVSLSVLPIHHTYEHTCDIMASLYQGGTVALCEGLKHIFSDMREVKASLMMGVPLIYEMMYKRIWKQAEKNQRTEKLKIHMDFVRRHENMDTGVRRLLFNKDVHAALGGNMRCMVSGAAAIDPDIVEFFNTVGIKMIQGYGMTESSPLITLNRDRYHKNGSVGQAMFGSRVKIDDPDEDGIGEVLTRSESVMLGYYEDELNTAAAFKDGWLRTGDYGYLDDEGFLYLTGRKKNVIITKNGKNVFPEEVEFYLMKSPYISEVIVSGDEDGRGDLVVTAHIVPDMAEITEAFGELDTEGLNKIFKEVVNCTNDQMPSYKRIRRVEIRREEFRKTSTHKIRRNAETLKAPEGSECFEA